MVMIICAVSLSCFCLLKQVCDLKAENARLRSEHQRYQYLKEVVRAQVPEDRFIHNVPRSVSIIETEEVPVYMFTVCIGTDNKGQCFRLTRECAGGQ